MPDEEQNPGEEPEINAVPVNLADIVTDDELEDEEVPEEEESTDELDDLDVEDDGEEEDDGGLGSMMDDIFADEAEEDDRLKAFGDLEHLTMVEVTAEVEAVLEELRIRQGGDE